MIKIFITLLFFTLHSQADNLAKKLTSRAHVIFKFEKMKLKRTEPGDGICHQEVYYLKGINEASPRECVNTLLYLRIKPADDYLTKLFPEAAEGQFQALHGKLYMIDLTNFQNAENILARIKKRLHKAQSILNASEKELQEIKDLKDKKSKARARNLVNIIKAKSKQVKSLECRVHSFKQIVTFKHFLIDLYKRTKFKNLSVKDSAKISNLWHQAFLYHCDQNTFKRLPTDQKGGGGWYNRAEYELRSFLK